MIKKDNKQQLVVIKNGLVAFFDILGFKKILLKNGIEESLGVVNTCMLEALKQAEKQRVFKKIKIKSFVISDSILIALPNLTSTGVFAFTNFCDCLSFELRIGGLPARGAIASGEFAFQTGENQINFVGQPIIDAHKLADSLEVAACAVVPSSEGKVLNSLTRKSFQSYSTPIKDDLCKSTFPKLNLLKYGNEFRREKIIKYFISHKKSLDKGSQKKLNNTIEFLNECGELKPVLGVIGILQAS